MNYTQFDFNIAWYILKQLQRDLPSDYRLVLTRYNNEDAFNVLENPDLLSKDNEVFFLAKAVIYNPGVTEAATEDNALIHFMIHRSTCTVTTATTNLSLAEVRQKINRSKMNADKKTLDDDITSFLKLVSLIVEKKLG